jgi:5-methylcytosine-specific restriction endonuclease McrA
VSNYSCVICGQTTPSNKAKKVCGAECRRIYGLRKGAELHARMKNDPDYIAKRRASAAATYEKNKHRTAESRHAWTLAWRERNAKQMADYNREYRKANPDKVRAKNLARRARQLNAFVEHVDPLIVWERDNGCCGICFQQIDPSLLWPDKMSKTLDHIVPLSKGGEHSYANAQIAHAVCNSRKNDRLIA